MGLTLGYYPHPTQARIHLDRSIRFRAVCCGRRWGKTRFAAAELLDTAAAHGGLYAWIAPTYYIAERGENAVKLIGGDMVQLRGQNPVRATFTGGGPVSEVRFLSADNPDTILGDGFDGVIVDEAARIERSVWEMNIRPALADKQGWAVLISTPRARNWFFDFHTRGRDPRETLYRSYSFTSLDNPYFLREEWDEAKRTTPEDVFRQEYEAEFLEDSAGVFRNLSRCLIPALELQSPAYSLGPVLIGCDIAKHTDFTVLIAMDSKTGRCFDMERFNHLDWPIQKERILAFARKHRGKLILDATGAGDPIYDDLARVYSNIVPFKFTAHSKVELIQRLIVAVEQQKVSWPDGRVSSTMRAPTDLSPASDSSHWSILTDELKRFEYAISPSGSITYFAPSGYHDDCVIALALANLHRREYQHTGSMHPFSPQSFIRSLRAPSRTHFG